MDSVVVAADLQILFAAVVAVVATSVADSVAVAVGDVCCLLFMVSLDHAFSSITFQLLLLF